MQVNYGNWVAGREVGRWGRRGRPGNYLQVAECGVVYYNML